MCVWTHCAPLVSATTTRTTTTEAAAAGAKGAKRSSQICIESPFCVPNFGGEFCCSTDVPGPEVVVAVAVVISNVLCTHSPQNGWMDDIPPPKKVPWARVSDQFSSPFNFRSQPAVFPFTSCQAAICPAF